MMFVRVLAILACVAGVMMLYPTWSMLHVYNQGANTPSGLWTWARGYNVWPGLVAGILYLLLGCLLIGSFGRTRLSLWQPMMMMLGSAAIAIITGLFMVNHPLHLPGRGGGEHGSSATDFRILKGKAEVNISEEEFLAKIGSDKHLSIHADVAPSFSLGIALALMLIAALELRFSLSARAQRNENFTGLGE
jgi:hypothetical protein